MTREFVLATGNQGKVKELAEVLSPYAINLRPQSDFNVSSVAETGGTFAENAIIKARHAASETGLPAIADDSGLAVDALGGAPGIYSARYAGADASDTDNIHKLLSELKDVPAPRRGAQFHCCLVFMRSAEDPTPVIAQGIWRGQILTQPTGTEGFGYDPVFWVEEHKRSAAQMSKAEKNQISHRGNAIKLLLPQLLEAGVLTQKD